MSSLLLSKGARADDTNEDGDTPLHVAASQGQAKLASLLLSFTKELFGKEGGGGGGAIVDIANNAGSTPLHWTANIGHEEVGSLLLSHGANVGHKDNNQWTALHYAGSLYLISS